MDITSMGVGEGVAMLVGTSLTGRRFVRLAYMVLSC